MTQRRGLLIGISLAAAGFASSCTAAQIEADITSFLQQAGIDAAQAQLFYGFAKGIVETVGLVIPGLSSAALVAFGIMDPIMADVEAGIATAQQIATIITTAVKIVNVAAPGMTATANTPAVTASALRDLRRVGLRRF